MPIPTTSRISYSSQATSPLYLIRMPYVVHMPPHIGEGSGGFDLPSLSYLLYCASSRPAGLSLCSGAARRVRGVLSFSSSPPLLKTQISALNTHNPNPKN